jgi:hypothetical protein
MPGSATIKNIENTNLRIPFSKAYEQYAEGKAPDRRTDLENQFQRFAAAEWGELNALLLKPEIWFTAFDIASTALSEKLINVMKRPHVHFLLRTQTFAISHRELLTPDGSRIVLGHMGNFIDKEANEQAIENIQLKERKLFGIAWWQLFVCLLNSTLDRDATERSLAEVFQIYALHGPEIFKTKKPLMGRVLGREQFRAILEASGIDGTDKDLTKIITKLCHKPRSHRSAKWKVPKHLEHVPLGRWVMWATYSESNPDSDPFAQVTTDDQLRTDDCTLPCRLGLPTNPKASGGWLIFRYRLPSEVSVYCPTVADAYAGGIRRCCQFRPASEDAETGRTRPCPDCAERKLGLPECVHAPVEALYLVAPVETLR